MEIEQGMFENISNIISKEINEKKANIIKQRIKEVIGIEIDEQEELKRRFKRFATYILDNEESIYFNDGSIGGVRIVTFIKNEMPSYTENSYSQSLTLSYEEKYY